MEIKTPCKLNYYMPAEWVEHDATWLSWPTNNTTFPKNILNNVENIYCRIISALSYGEKVKVLVNDLITKKIVLKKLDNFAHNDKNIIFYEIKTADVWTRDYSPIFLINHKTNEKAVVKWKYNAYGEKYDDLLYDDVAGTNIAEVSGVKIFTPGIILEGGSIDVDGEGTLLTTERCLLNKNRNPNLNKNQIEEYLREYLGVSKIIWLKSGIRGDDTDGHVDNFARFVAKGKVICAYSSENDPNYFALNKNLEILCNSVDACGNEFEIIKIPVPKPIINIKENKQLPASYANFYIGNKVILLPIFNDANDTKVIEILKNVFPEREVIPISARDLVFGYGGIHCITQQEPTKFIF